MFVCYAIYNNPSHFTRVLLNRSIQNIVETETRAIVDMAAAGRRGPPSTVEFYRQARNT